MAFAIGAKFYDPEPGLRGVRGGARKETADFALNFRHSAAAPS